MIKTLIYIAFILCINLTAFGDDIWEDSAISGEDLVELLELRINKYSIEFDEPKLVTLHFKSSYQSSEWSLDVSQTKVSVLVYEPKETNKMTVKIKGESHGGSTLSFGSYDEDKVHFKTVKYRGGLEIVAKESEEAEDSVFRLWVTTKAP